jgi:hypothetical protein
MHTITSKLYRINSDVSLDVVDTITAWTQVADNHAAIIHDGTQTAVSVQVWWDEMDPPEIYRNYSETFLSQFAQWVTEITE